MERIRDAIIRQAVEDYKDIVDGKIKKITHDCNLKELKRFFESEHCNNLLCDVSITGRQILDGLEEYKNFAYRRRLKQAHKQLALGSNEDMEEAWVILRFLREGVVFLGHTDGDTRAYDRFRKIGIDMITSKRGCAVATLKNNQKINKLHSTVLTFIP